MNTDCRVFGRFYDKEGNAVRIETSNNKVGASASFSKTEYEYDEWGRLLTAILYDGNARTYQQYRYDGLGRTTAQYTGLSAPLSFRGNTAVSGGDSDYSRTTFEYDYLGNVIKTVDALGNIETAQYDNAGNLVRTVDANGTVSVMGYDLLGRKTSERITGDGETISRSYTFDSIGCMTSVTENGDATYYTYNGKGLVTGETAGHISKEYSYDIQGNMTESAVREDGDLIQQTLRQYDSMGRLSSAADSDGNGADYTYDRDSRLVKAEYSNGASETAAYNAAGYVTRLVNKASDGSVISEYAYTYYVTGSHATKADASGTTTYTYDGQNRLKTAVYSDGTKDVYTFDDSGNRLTKTFTDSEGTVTVTNYEYDAANRLVSSTDGEDETVYTYDDCGNLLRKESSDETIEQSYDLLGRMVSYTDGETEASYDYYTSNMRRSKTVDGETTVHVWIGDNIAADMGANSAAYLQGVKLLPMR